MPEIHQALRDRGIPIAERTVTHLLQRYEELVSLHFADQQRLRRRSRSRDRSYLPLMDYNQMSVTKSFGFCAIVFLGSASRSEPVERL